jgi:hypothetical protein
LWGVGEVVNERDSGAFDLLDFNVSFGPDVAMPASYGGVSGGGLWRVEFTRGSGNQLVPGRKLVVGIVYWESASTAEGERTLTAHGPRSIYVELLNAARGKWKD